jgi:hypothetical protein
MPPNDEQKDEISINVGDTILAKLTYETKPYKIVKERSKRELLFETEDGTRDWIFESKLRLQLKGKED